MPYIDTRAWFDAKLGPQEGEGYQDFMDRVVPAMLQLQPEASEAEVRKMANDAWNNHVLEKASEVTLTMKREVQQYSDAYLMETHWSDWEVTEIHSARMANMTFSSLEKARKNEGKEFQIAKAAEEKQMVFGWANIAKDVDGSFPLDWDGDVTRPEDLEDAAYTFVLKYREAGEQHEGEAVGQLVESVVFTKDKQQAMGIPEGIVPEGWWVGFYIPDKEVFAKIKNGEYEMFSVQGKAIRTPTGN